MSAFRLERNDPSETLTRPGRSAGRTAIGIVFSQAVVVDNPGFI